MANKSQKEQNRKGFVISTKETRAIANRRSKSPQVTPQRESNLCRASREDFSFAEMTRLCVTVFEKKLCSKILT
jgi:hypothetical protein